MKAQIKILQTNLCLCFLKISTEKVLQNQKSSFEKAEDIELLRVFRLRSKN